MSLKCPLCNAHDIVYFTEAIDYMNLKNDKLYHAYKCNHCNLLFQYPFPKPEEFNSMYMDNYYAHVEDNNLPFVLRYLDSLLKGDFKSKIYSPLKKSLYPYFSILQDANKILDIGCGKGLFLDVMKNNGKETYALEPNVNAANILQKKGHNTVQGFISDSNFEENYFELVTGFQVFEHIDDPDSFLQGIYKILKPNGYFIIEMPNGESNQAKNKKFWVNLDLPRHVLLHSPKSIISLAKKYNFEISVLTRVSPSDIKITYFRKHNINSPLKQKIYSYLLLPKILYQYIFKSSKGSLLIAILKKPN